MSLFNDKLKTITLKEVCVLIVVLSAVYFIFNSFDIMEFDSIWVYIFIIAYFIYKLRCCFSSLKDDFNRVFSRDFLKYTLLVVVLNIFLSYGLLYLSSFILDIFPGLNFLAYVQFTSMHLNASILAAGSFFAVVFISPIFEELLFRGVMLNRFKLIMPLTISILLMSLLFAAMHTFGSITSAFVFSICMAILYLKTDNILVPIFAHFLNNLLAESIVNLDVNNILFTNDVVICVISFLAIISAILIFVSIYSEWNNLKSNEL